MELLYDVFYNRLRENFIKMNENSCNSRNSSNRSSSNNSTNCYNNYLLQYENYNNSFNIYLNNDYGGNQLIDIVSVDRGHHHHDHDSNNNNKIVINKNNNNTERLDDSDNNDSSDEKEQISLWQPWKLSNSHNITATTKDTKVASKELPTTKWRRDRRLRTSPEYHQSAQLQQPPQPTTPTSLPFANCLRLSSSANDVDLAPLDMSLTVKPRSPPPPYRAPLPGSIYASCVSNSINRNDFTSCGNNPNLNHSSSSSSSSDSVSPRPSVITQAPKRDAKGVKCKKESISMCDPVIDEHFRRSLGDNYMILFSQNGQSSKKQKPNELDDDVSRPRIDNSKIKSEASSDAENDEEDDDIEEEDGQEYIGDDDVEIDVQHHDEHNNDEDISNMMDTQSNASTTSSLSNGIANIINSSSVAAAVIRTASVSPKILNNNNNNSNSDSVNIKPSTTTTTISSDSIELSVDDHFAKALGEAWKKIQENNTSNKKATLRPCVN